MVAAARAGRVGALAVTLGIGAAIAAAGTGLAGAETPAADGVSGQDGAAETRRSAPRDTAARRDARAHPPGRVAAASRSGVSPAAAGTAESVGVQPNRMTRTSRLSSRARAAAPLTATAGPATMSVAAKAATPVDPVSAVLNNRTPAVSATQTGQAGAVVSGTIDVNDPDSIPVGVAVGRRPVHGTAVVSGAQFTYTANPAAPGVHTGFTDTFGVVVNDADAGFHIHGLAGLINLLTFGLIGASGHTSATTVTVTVAPFNNIPTGTASAGEPDPVTGAVTGRVIGTDLNNDALSYTGTALTAKGAVIVSPTGQFTYTPRPEVFAAATPGEQDGFTVTIDDGYGGIAAVTLTVPVGRPAPTAELSTFCGCTLMPADTVFHADVSALPILEKSATWMNLLGGTLHTSWGRTPWQGSSGGMPVNVVGPNHPTEAVIFNRGYNTSGPSIDARPYAIPDRPLVEGMPDVPAWDRHLLVFQEGTCISQELYNVANGVELPAAGLQDALGNAAYAALWGSSWIAEAGVHIDMNSGLYPAQGWANASRLPYLPLILRPDDLERGTIDHMLGMSIAKDRGTGYSWPARAGDGTGTNPDGVPMGTVLRLNADFDLTGYQPGTQVVLRGLQQHGAVVYDSFAAGRDGAGLLVMSNGWSGTAHFTVQDELNTIPLSAFEAVDVLSLALDPTAGWMIRI